MTPWSLTSVHPALSPDEVHIWRVALDLPAEQVAELAQTLSPDERERSGHLSVEAARRFVVSRSTLRALVGRYLGVEPAGPRFEYGRLGKPSLAWPPGGATLKFNLAHSHELAVLAFTWDRELGVDVEHWRDLPNLEQLAAVCFSPSENAALRHVPAEQLRELFYNAWTRKEAYIKAVGSGLAYGLRAFDVSMLPGEPVRIVRAEREPEAVWQWALEAMSPGPGYTGAVAVRGNGWQLRCWQF